MPSPSTPPKGYALVTPPTPPAGYSLPPIDNTVPTFIREGMDTSKVQQVVEPASQQGAPDVAGAKTIAESTPGKIAVYDPAKYTAQTRNHEMTHQFQQTRSDGTIHLPGGYELAPFGQAKSQADQKYVSGDPKNYDYGGEAGLIAARNSGKTMADFNQEQQADIVARYKAKQDEYLAKAKAGTMTKDDLHAMYQTYKAYHPFIQQLASVPKSLADTLPSFRTLMGFGKPTPLAPKPEAPGLPAYDTPGLHVAPADPLMGGQSQPTKR